MSKSTIKGSFLILLSAVIWGGSLAFQSLGVKALHPFAFNFYRSTIGGLALLVPIAVVYFVNRGKRGGKPRGDKLARKNLVVSGLICGVIMCVVISLQATGIQFTSVAKAGFITACYIIFVPFLGLALKRRPTIFVWLALGLALVGLYVLCLPNQLLSFNKGDVLLLLASFVLAIHITVVGYYAPKVNGMQLSCVQLLVCGVLSGILMLFFATPQIHMALEVWQPILYTGILSCAIAYALQITGQKTVNPTAASFIMSLEAVFSVAAGWLILGETLSLREIMGCCIMFVAIILSQWPFKRASAPAKHR